MVIQSRIREFLRPSLGKIGLAGIGLCLALGAYIPADTTPPVTSSDPQPNTQLALKQSSP
jgi:hypothetical protein